MTDAKAGLTPEQIARVEAAAATWPPPTPTQKAQLRVLF
jgi:hypothetical protein